MEEARKKIKEGTFSSWKKEMILQISERL
jgi:hypothetical protein